MGQQRDKMKIIIDNHKIILLYLYLTTKTSIPTIRNSNVMRNL